MLAPTRQNLAVLRAAGKPWTFCMRALGIGHRELGVLTDGPEWREDLARARAVLLDAAITRYLSPAPPPPPRPAPARETVAAALIEMGVSPDDAEELLRHGMEMLRERHAPKVIERGLRDGLMTRRAARGVLALGYDNYFNRGGRRDADALRSTDRREAVSRA